MTTLKKGKKPNKKEQIVEDVHFIFTECIRLAELPINEIMALPPIEHFSEIPHPSGKGKMLCGSAAHKKVYELTERAIKHAKLINRVKYQNYVDDFAKLLITKFVKEKADIDIKQIDRIFSSVGKIAKNKCQTQTHFIPCRLMAVDEPDEIKIGPVIFRNRKNFRKIIIKKSDEYKSTITSSESKKYVRGLLADAIRYYRSFRWIAEVT